MGHVQNPLQVSRLFDPPRDAVYFSVTPNPRLPAGSGSRDNGERLDQASIVWVGHRVDTGM